jgi:SAM-dependent methyltransferase
VVDVGCGAKPYRDLFHPSVTEYVGVDRPGPHATPDVEADAHALPFEDGRFDAGVSFQVFEHVERPAQCVGELARVVRSGGDVVFTVPGVWPAHEVPHDHWRFTRYGLEAVVRGAGLTLVELAPLGALWSTLGQMACLELDRSRLGRGLIPLVNLAARSLDRTAREELVMNWLVHARRP